MAAESVWHRADPVDCEFRARYQTRYGCTRISRKSRGSSMAEWRRTGLGDARIQQPECSSSRALGEQPRDPPRTRPRRYGNVRICGDGQCADPASTSSPGRWTEADCDRQPVPRGGRGTRAGRSGIGAGLPLLGRSTNAQYCPFPAIRWSQIGCLRRVEKRHSRFYPRMIPRFQKPSFTA